jgi:hypothetical protein
MCLTVIGVELVYLAISLMTYMKEFGNDYFDVEYGVYVELTPTANNYQLLLRLRALELGMTMYAFSLFVMGLVAKDSIIDSFMCNFFPQNQNRYTDLEYKMDASYFAYVLSSWKDGADDIGGILN